LKLTKRKTLIGCVLTIIFACSCAYLNLPLVRDFLDRLCDEDAILAQLDAGNDRLITISAQSCWEVSRAVDYEVRERGAVVSAKSLIDTDDGNDNSHNYSLIYAENKSLVGVTDNAATPAQVVVIYDFKSGDKWAVLGDTHKGQARDLFSRLKLENPELNIPPSYQ
jgi:hypothetical protein